MPASLLSNASKGLVVTLTVFLAVSCTFAGCEASLQSATSRRSFTTRSPAPLRGSQPRLLSLRGGGETITPTLQWSQRPGTIFMKVELPSGITSAEGLTCNEKKLEWKEGAVNLEVEFFAELDPEAIKITRDE